MKTSKTLKKTLKIYDRTIEDSLLIQIQQNTINELKQQNAIMKETIKVLKQMIEIYKQQK